MKTLPPVKFCTAASLGSLLMPLAMIFLVLQLPGQTQSLKEHIYVDGGLIATERSSSVTPDYAKSGDYDSDKKADLAVFRPSTGYWYIKKSGDPGNPISVQCGTSTDNPVPADYDGDGKADAAYFRPSTGYWYIQKSSDPGNHISINWGASGDLPVSDVPRLQP